MSQESNLNSRLSHLDADTDQSITAIHHTLGPAPTQASPGSHRHDGSDSVKIKATDIDGDIPAANGLPPGGLEGQILVKETDTDYDTIWIDNFTPQVKHLVKNDSGSAMTAGQVVYISGANGTNMLVSLADADSDSTSATTIGLLEQDLAINGIGYVVTEGLIDGLDTSMATAGDPVWLSSTPGGKLYGLANKPQAPVHIVYLGVVTRAQSNNGEIFISVNNGWELEELHDVKITSVAAGEVIQRTASNLWENKTLAEAGIASTTHASTHASGGSDAITIAPAQVTGTAVITTDSRLSDARTPTAHASTHIATGSDPLFLSQSQITGLTTALAGKASTTHASTHADGGSDEITIAPAQVTGTAVITTDSRLSDARTPTAHASTHASGGSDAITVAQSQVTGLTTALAGKASTTHSGTHSDGGSDPVYIEQAQVNGLTTALSGKASTTHAITHIATGSDPLFLSQSQITNLTTDLSNKASSTHVHGNITNTGTVTTSVTATNPVKVLITNSSNAVGTLTTTNASSGTFLRGDGTWNAVPAATIYVAANRTTSTTGTTALAVNTGETFAITFPSGRFSVSPSVTASTSQPRFVAAVTQVTTSGFTLSVRNVSDATGTTYLYHWQAIEIIAGMGN